jgi:hypothetical protein
MTTVFVGLLKDFPPLMFAGSAEIFAATFSIGVVKFLELMEKK